MTCFYWVRKRFSPIWPWDHVYSARWYRTWRYRSLSWSSASPRPARESTSYEYTPVWCIGTIYTSKHWNQTREERAKYSPNQSFSKIFKKKLLMNKYFFFRFLRIFSIYKVFWGNFSHELIRREKPDKERFPLRKEVLWACWGLAFPK